MMAEEVDLTSWHETRRYLRQLLNEVLNGLAVDTELQLQAERKQVSALAERLGAMADEHMLSSRDGVVLVRAARLCEEQLCGDEFFTRTGFTIAEAHEINARLERIAAQSVPPQTHAAAS